MKVFADRAEQLLAGADQPPGEHDAGGVKDMLKAHAPDCQVIAGLVPDAPGERVAGACRLGDLDRGDCLAGLQTGFQRRILTGLHGLDQAFGDGVGRAVAFQAAALPTGAWSPVWDGDHVADFGGVLEGTADELCIDDHAAADAGSQRQHDHVADAAAGTGHELAERGDVGIVVERDRQPGRRAEPLAQRDVLPPGQVGGGVDDAFLVR